MSYLGTDLTPDAYYAAKAEEYANPQRDAVAVILKRLSLFLEGPVLDLGCGAGLGTEILRGLGVTDVTGTDRSPEMVERYHRETGRPACVANFWDELPAARTAMAIHSLHLCDLTRVWQLKWRLQAAGVKNLVVVSPLKRAVDGLGLTERARTSAPSGDARKTVWGWALQV